MIKQVRLVGSLSSSSQHEGYSFAAREAVLSTIYKGATAALNF